MLVFQIKIDDPGDDVETNFIEDQLWDAAVQLGYKVKNVEYIDEE